MNCFFGRSVFPCGEWNVYVPASIAFVIPQRQLVMQAMTYINYMYDHLEEFQLLLKCSKGSRVENFIEEITNQYAKQNSEFVKAAYEAGYTKYLPSDIEIHILTHGYITALCECILHDVPYEKAEDYVKNIIKFQHYGWYGVLGLPFK